MPPFGELKLAKLDIMDADLNNCFNEMRAHDSLSIPEKLCFKLACSSSDMMHDASTDGISAYKHAYSRSGTVCNVSVSGLPTHTPQESVEKQSKSDGNETSNEDLNVQNPRNIDGCVYESQKKPCLHVAPSLAPKDAGSKEALAGLIFMSNDKVRRSYFKYHVLGMPISRKHIVDRVKIGTKLFLFEFEARQLWGIYEATSETSLDIEKDAYQASSAPLPAQVKFRVLKKCRPLPERLFQWVIKENYFTSIKFNPELTAQQVLNLIQLYDMQAVGDRKLSCTSFAAENNTRLKNDAIDALIVDSNKMVYKGPFSAEHIGIPHMRRLMDREAHDNLERASLNLENSHLLKTLDQIIQSGDIQRGAPLRMARPLPNTANLFLEAKSTANNISHTQDEVFQADDPKRRNGKAELLLHTGKPTLESKRQGMIDDVKISTVMSLMGGSNTHLDAKRSSGGPVEDRCLLYELKVRPPVMQQPCKYCKALDRNKQQYPCGHGDPSLIESCEHNTLLGNMKIIASPSVCVKCLSNDLRPASRRKNNEEQNKAHDKKDKLLHEQENALSYHHLYDSILGKNSRQSLDMKSSPLLTEVVQWDAQPQARKDTSGSTLTHAHPVDKRDLVLGDFEARAREALDSVLHKNNSCSTPMSANARNLPWPDDGAWPQDHATSSFHPSTSKTPAWLDHQTGFPDVDHGDKSTVDNPTCVTRQNKLSENDGILQDRKLERVANGIVTQDHMTDDDAAWLERARGIVLESLKARSNNIMGDACRRREEDAFMQFENQVQVLGKRSRLAISSANNDDAKPRGSVWSRLSFPRKTSKAMQVVLQVQN